MQRFDKPFTSRSLRKNMGLRYGLGSLTVSFEKRCFMFPSIRCQKASLQTPKSHSGALQLTVCLHAASAVYIRMQMRISWQHLPLIFWVRESVAKNASWFHQGKRQGCIQPWGHGAECCLWRGPAGGAGSTLLPLPSAGLAVGSSAQGPRRRP